MTQKPDVTGSITRVRTTSCPALLPARFCKSPEFWALAWQARPEDVMDAPHGPGKRAPFAKEHWQ
jgi:hypothetical protein